MFLKNLFFLKKQKSNSLCLFNFKNFYFYYFFYLFNYFYFLNFLYKNNVLNFKNIFMFNSFNLIKQSFIEDEFKKKKDFYKIFFL
jgi:hypothetical protein